jgi:hypothetical protein
MARKRPEFTQKVKKQIESWKNTWKDNVNQYNEFMQFIMGNQWLDEEARVFEQYQKIPLTFNKIAPLANHLLGEQRQNTPSLQVVPEEDANENDVEVREALVKDISLSSDARVVYQTAFFSAAVGGFGAIEVGTEYDDNEGFDQHLVVKNKPMPQRCFWDPSANELCKTDGEFSGYEMRVSRAKFRNLYGKEIEASIGNTLLTEGTPYDDDDAVTIFNYFMRKTTKVKLYRLSNGRTVDDKEFAELERVEIDEKEMLLDQGMPVTIEATRTAPRYKIYHYKLAGEYELEKTETVFKQLPLVFVDQNSYFDKTGKQICRPFFKDTKDAQKYINYIGTTSAYLLKISRYDQFLVSKQNVRSNDTQQAWRDPLSIKGGLYFDESPSQFVPQQLRPPELPQSFIQQYERALMDIQNATGMYNAQLGNQGNEISGAAIDARTKRGSYNTYVPFDNLNRAIACVGQIINESAGDVYDTERTLQLNLKDKGMTAVRINERQDDYGMQVKNDMTKGKYKIRLVPGPSWEGQKQEALESLETVLKANPQIFNLVADLFAENLPLANNIQLRNRLRTLVPPEVIEAGKTGQPIPPKPPQPDPMLMLKMQELKLKEGDLQLKQQKLQLEAQESGENIKQKWAQLENERQITAAELEEAELRYLGETQRTQADQNIAHANNLISLLTHKGTHHE